MNFAEAFQVRTRLAASGTTCAVPLRVTSSERWPTQPAVRCLIDQIPVDGHLRCRGCEILIGPRHYDSRLMESGYCPSCHASRERRRRRETETTA